MQKPIPLLTAVVLTQLTILECQSPSHQCHPAQTLWSSHDNTAGMVQSSLLQSLCLSIYHPKPTATFQKHNYAILLLKNFIDCHYVKKNRKLFHNIYLFFSLSGLTKLNIFFFVLVLLLKDLKFHLISDLMLSHFFVLACVSSSFINNYLQISKPCQFIKKTKAVAPSRYSSLLKHFFCKVSKLFCTGFFIWWLFIDPLLYAIHYSGCWEHSSGQVTQIPALKKLKF